MFGRDQYFAVPGLFSELFNVAASRPAQMTTEWPEASPARAFRQGKSRACQLLPAATAATAGNVFFAFMRRLFYQCSH
jgi:hypothetical protein